MSVRDTLTGMLWDNYALGAKNAVIDAYRDEVRAEALEEAAQYLARHGYTDSAYLLRTTDLK